jgi:hypothetical protein
MLNLIPNFNILSYLVAVFDLNSNFSNFPIATGKNGVAICTCLVCGANHWTFNEVFQPKEH